MVVLWGTAGCAVVRSYQAPAVEQQFPANAKRAEHAIIVEFADPCAPSYEEPNIFKWLSHVSLQAILGGTITTIPRKFDQLKQMP